MSVSPIEYRYFTKEMKSLFTEEYKLQKWLDVEVALAKAHAKIGNISKGVSEIIQKKGSTKFVKLERVKEIENQIHHDIMAMVRAFAEGCEEGAGGYIHLGATSYDIVDTAWALILKDALKIIENRLLDLKKELINIARREKNTVCVGRTHGQHAVPTTYGMKFALWASEINRHLERNKDILHRSIAGKMSGMVGTMASFGEKGFEIQKLVMSELDIKESEISNQIVPRDLHSEIFFFLALVGTTLSKIAKEIRNLQRSEIAEMFEPFKKSQVGSSTLASKRNPHKSERICGLFRVIYSNLIPVLDNAALQEHERDLSNSACERVIYPQTFILLDYMLTQMISIIQGLEFNYENINRNLALTKGQIFAENIMIKLVEKGFSRQIAHEKLRKIAIRCKKENIDFRKGLLDDSELNQKISSNELDQLLDPKNYIGTAVQQVERIIKKYD
ncbi:MAG: adenylosuccinate lyase [Candidatus Helarchaeota archaeon]|nr:adenylosuccinate lyase [Candidatus Helarchaeota archaeon]